MVLTGITTLGPSIGEAIDVEVDVVIARDDVSALTHAFTEEIVDVAEQLRALAIRLPDHGIRIVYDDVRDGAVADLAEGIMSPQRALLAAGVLDLETGWPALATALRTGEAHCGWRMSVRELLSRFRGVDEPVVDHVSELAGVNPETAFADVNPDGIARLASALDRHARDGS